MERKFKLGQTLYFLSEYGYLKTAKVAAIYDDNSYGIKRSPTSPLEFIYPANFDKYYTGISQIPNNLLMKPYLTR